MLQRADDPRAPRTPTGRRAGGPCFVCDLRCRSVATGLSIDWLATLFAYVSILTALAAGALLVRWLMVKAARARSITEQRRAERRRPTPYVFHPPAGWPMPPADWVPPPNWQPQPSWPPQPHAWELWQRLLPRPVPPPPPQQSVWETQRDKGYQPSRFDEQELRRAASTEQGRVALRLEALSSQALALEQRMQFDREHLDAQRGRSRWHPLEWAYWRAADALHETASTVSGRLGGDAPVDVDELVMLWKQQLGWLDELVGAARDRAGLDPQRRSTGKGAPVLSSGDDWKHAEQVAASALRQFGFPDARVTGSGTDRGLDVVGNGIAAQVKYTGSTVGRPVIQQLVGAAGGRQTAFFSRAGYSQHAVDEADAQGMALFSITLPSTVTAINRAGRRMATR